jgi:maleylpyruvate isomerase
MRLYDYRRSSAAYRVRIALNLKGVDYETAPINIAPGSDEQLGAAYRQLNAQQRVPAIEVDGRISGQSMAILEWIDETYPDPPFLPKDPWQRLEIRAFADTIACDIHPLNNLSPLAVLRSEFGADDAAISRWYLEWVRRGFTALEVVLARRPHSTFAFGDTVSLADIVLVPQMANARRFNLDLSPFPRLVSADGAACNLDAFYKASPEQQAT